MTIGDIVISGINVMMLGEAWNHHASILETFKIYSSTVQTMQTIAAQLLVLFVLLEAISIYKNNSLNTDAPKIAFSLIWGAIICIPGSYEFFVVSLTRIFTGITEYIGKSTQLHVMAEIDALMNQSILEITKEVSILGSIFEMSSPLFLVSKFFFILFLIILFGMPLLMKVAIQFWLVIGPVLLVAGVFKPFRHVAMFWFTGLIAALFASIMGIIVYSTLAEIQLFSSMGNSLKQMDGFTFSTLCIVASIALLMLPVISYQLWNAMAINPKNGFKLVMAFKNKLPTSGKFS